MIDLWLIINLLLPFILVLLLTYMDSLRTDSNQGEGEKRSINHHGKTLIVGKGATNEERTSSSIQVAPVTSDSRQADLVHRNEILELQVNKLFIDIKLITKTFLIQARKKLYKSIRENKTKESKIKLRRVMLFTRYFW